VYPGGGLGSYNLTFPSTAPCADNVNTCNFTLYNPVGGGSVSTIKKGATYQGPFQSHMWWTSALWNAYMPMCTAPGTQSAAYYHSMQLRNYHSEPMYPNPFLIIQAMKYGYSMRNRLMALGGGGVNNTGNFFYDEDIVFGFSGDTSAKTEVMDYGDMHATFQQEVYSGQPNAGNIMKLSASQGSPYLFFTCPSTNTSEPTFFLFFLKTVAISSSGNSITINRSCCPGGSNQSTWGYISLFFPPGTTISNDGITYYSLSSLPLNSEFGGNNVYWRIRFPNKTITNYFTAACVTDPSQAALDEYEKYAFNHITASTFSYNYTESSATLTSTFNFTTNNVLGGANTGTLMLLYLHQYLYSPDFAANATTYTYTSSRGVMKVMKGNQFTTVMKNYGILPGMGWANTADKTQLNTFINNYATRGAINIGCGNPVYGSFGSLEEAARIAVIAHQAGNITARDKLLTIAKNGIEAWLTSPNTDNAAMYFYDPDFNWLTPYPSAFDADRLLQDSHFHHGYLIFAAAIVAKFEPAGSTWVSQWGPMIEVVLRNINSELRPSATSPGASTPWIPYLRYYDPYVGHSWAGSDGSNQESVSEAINFAAGVALWGETTGNTSVRDLGLMMYITETEAARMYWWDGPRRGVNNGGNCGYAPNYNHYHGAIVGNGGVAYATYFGANVSYVHGITYVPITGASIWMGVDSLGAANEYADFLASNGGEPNGSDGFWHVALLMEKATFDASGAKNQFVNQALPGNWAGADYQVDGYSWITTFDSVGVVDPTVQANTASYAVFRKDNCKHYMIYNPRNRGARTVTFSDGQSFNVPADTIITYKVCNIVLPVILSSFTATLTNGDTYLKWTTATEINADHFEIERSLDGKNFVRVLTVKASGHPNDYRAIDYSVPTGIIYYRLKLVDVNGEYSSSQMIKVVNHADHYSSVDIYPNPAEKELFIPISSTIEQNITIELYSVIGDLLIRREEKITNTGSSLVKQDISPLATGTYVIKVITETEGEIVVKKITKY